MRPLKLRYIVGAGAGLVLVGWQLYLAGHQYWLWALLCGLLLLAGAGVQWRHRRGGSAGLVHRWAARSRRHDGVASVWTILRVSSSWAARRKAAILRPSLAELSWWARWRVPIRELATPLARVGWLRVWSPIEDVTLRLGGPRTGKTGELCGRILDAPGSVVATSTRTDLIDHTRALRSRRGPVYVFNPSGVGGLASTITFSPLSGCEDPATATARATDLIAGTSLTVHSGGVGDREYWEGHARRTLAVLLHAAALGDLTMWEVLAWLASEDAAAPIVMGYLSRSPEPAFEHDAELFFHTSDRTRSSISATITPALGWLSDRTAAASANKGGFDVEALLADRGTVYLLGAEDAQVAPLVTALTGHIARQARRLAGRQPSGRLDPPLTLALDEAALICPIRLDLWTADMGGRGVTIHIAAQSRAQLRQRWGPDGAAAILNNAATVLIFGGGRDPDDLAAYSTLTGDRHERVVTRDSGGAVTSVSAHRVPVLSPAQIAQLPAGHAVVIRRGMPPAIGRPRMAWTRHDVRAARGPRAAVWSLRWAMVATWGRSWLAQPTPAVKGRPGLRVVPPPPESTTDAA